MIDGARTSSGKPSPDGRDLAVAASQRAGVGCSELNEAARVAPAIRGGEAVAEGDRLELLGRLEAAKIHFTLARHQDDATFRTNALRDIVSATHDRRHGTGGMD